MCLKESHFPDCWKVSSVVPVFKNVGERSTNKNYRLVSFLSVVSKVFEKLVNNIIVDHLEKYVFFSDFQYGFRSSWSTVDLLAVVYDRIARAFNRCGTAWAVVWLGQPWLGLTCWSSSQTKVLWNFRSNIWPYFWVIPWKSGHEGLKKNLWDWSHLYIYYTLCPSVISFNKHLSN